LPTPCNSAVDVKKYDTLPTDEAKNAGSVAGSAPGKKLMVVDTIAMVGPAARKLHIIMAMQMTVAMYHLYHCGLQRICQRRVRIYREGVHMLASSGDRWRPWTESG
jgi:hypothetical protein